MNTSQLTNGTHTITVAAETADGRVTRATTYNVNISNPTSFAANFDVPSIPSYNDAPYTMFDGIDNLAGWAVSTGSLSSVNITIDGIPVANAGIVSRQDVCNAYPGRPGCPYVGWGLAFDTGSVGDGLHELGVTTTFSDSSQVTEYAPFLIQNAPSPYTEYESGAGGGGSAVCNTPDKNLSSAAMIRNPGSDTNVHIVVDDQAGLGQALSAALQMWNGVASTTHTALDIVSGSPSHDLTVKYDTSPGQEDSGWGCAAYNPGNRTLYYGSAALASNNLPAVLAHEIGHYLGLADVTPFPSSPTLMNQTVNGCNFQQSQTTTVQPSDAEQVTTCRATTKLYAKNLANAQLLLKPQPPITVTTAASPSYPPYAGMPTTCTYTYTIVYYYVEGVPSGSETFVNTVVCQ